MSKKDHFCVSFQLTSTENGKEIELSQPLSRQDLFIF